MKKFLSVTLLASSLALLLPACEGSKNPTEVSSQYQGRTVASFALQSLLPQGIVLGGFTVSYNGRTVANNQTTFTYVVTGPRADFVYRLELPPCAGTLVSFKPATGDLNDNNGDDPFIPGIEWHLRAPSAGTTVDTFSVTYSGLVREGIVLTSIRPSRDYLTGKIAGACARVFDISGSVYNDANTNGIKEASEAGIPGVTVSLLDTNNVLLASLTSDPFGNYIFGSVPLGRYTLTLDTNTVATTSTKYVGATTLTFLSVTGGPDSPGNNFGFNPKTSQLITDLKLNILPTNGLTPGFWKKQLQAALSGKTAIVKKDSLLVYISRIRGLLLTEPYQFGTGNGLQAALDSLNLPTRTELGKLKQQLIALEFNWVSRHGIVGTDAPLELVLVGWGESLVAAAQSTGGTSTFSVRAPVATTMSLVTDATAVFGGINKSSGGGGSFTF